MKRFLFALFAFTLSSPAFAEVGVSVSVGEPGFYGRIDIGNFSTPQFIYPKPILIQTSPSHAAPLYLRVPPGHAKHWAKHCHEYGACGQPVYFVKDSWYNEVYVPHYHRYHGKQDWKERNEHHENKHHHGKGRKGHGH